MSVQVSRWQRAPQALSDCFTSRRNSLGFLRYRARGLRGRRPFVPDQRTARRDGSAVAMVARAGLPRGDRRHRVLRHLGFPGDPKLVQLRVDRSLSLAALLTDLSGLLGLPARDGTLAGAVGLAPRARRLDGLLPRDEETPTGYVLRNSLLADAPVEHRRAARRNAVRPQRLSDRLGRLAVDADLRVQVLPAHRGAGDRGDPHPSPAARAGPARRLLRFSFVAGRPDLGGRCCRPSAIRSSPGSPSSSCSAAPARCTPNGSRSTTGWDPGGGRLPVTLHGAARTCLGYPALAYLCLYLAVRLPI